VRHVNGNTYYTDSLKSTSTSPSKWFVGPQHRDRRGRLPAGPQRGQPATRHGPGHLHGQGQRPGLDTEQLERRHGLDGDPSTLWTFTLRSNGQHEIQNVHSAQLLNVAAGSGKPGAAIVQWPSQCTARYANDQWQPVRNSDGTYSFYNRNSQLALDNPGGSTVVGTAYGQWAPNDGAPQKFALVQR
jgi:hypothetical protein